MTVEQMGMTEFLVLEIGRGARQGKEKEKSRIRMEEENRINPAREDNPGQELILFEKEESKS